MLKIYYLVVVDMIAYLKKNNVKVWKFGTLMYMSAFLSIFIISISSIIASLFNFPINSSRSLVEIKLEAIYLYLIPAIIINYFIIFHNKKYQTLLEKYKSNDEKYILGFILSSLGAFFISIIVILLCNYNG